MNSRKQGKIMAKNKTLAIQASDLDHTRIDGTRIYLRELLKRFGSLQKKAHFTLYHRGSFNPNLFSSNFENYTVIQRPFPFAWMQTVFTWEIFRSKPEKLFLPIQAVPFFVSRKTEVTVTIHDLAFKYYPETFPWIHTLKLNLFLSMALLRADKIISVSESTKKDIQKFFPHIPSERIRVIYHGFDDIFFRTRVSSQDSDQVLKKYRVQFQKYILYVGALQPRKNLVRLIQAFNEAKKTVPDMKLVLAGEPAWLSQSLFEEREKSPFKNDIIMTGALSFSDIRIFYQGARFFVFPSLYEGFGLPILEAFASHTPVLTARNSSLTEVGGDAVLYCDASDTLHMSTQMLLLWNDEELREQLIEKGEMQVMKFSWDTCAQKTLKYILS